MKCAVKPSNAKPRRGERTSHQKESLAWFLHELGFEPEVAFKGVSGKRRWVVDWLYERNGKKVAVEYQGRGVGHQSVKGSYRDHDKNTELQVCGYTAIQCNARSVGDGWCFKWIEAAMGEEA